MITLTRRQVRDLRVVFRRHALGLHPRCAVPPLVLQADPETGLRVRYQTGSLAVEQRLPGSILQAETVALPLDALAELAGRDESSIAFEAVAPDRTIVRWEDRGIPQTREYAVPDLNSLPAFPEPAERFEEVPPDFLAALAAATEVVGDDSPRYDLACTQLKGATGEVVATDGRQLLIQRPGELPWDDDVLVQVPPFLADEAIRRRQPIHLGRSADHVVIQSGDLTAWMAIQAEARFPRLDGVFPADSEPSTCLCVDPADAASLATALARLPGGDAEHAPVTLDLNGQIAVRARADGQPSAELVLGRSRYTGAPVRVSTSRVFLGRALSLGFDAIRIAGPEQPLVCQDGTRAFAWQPLNPESAIPSSADAIRITPTEATVTPTKRLPRTRSERTIMPEPVPSHREDHEPPAATDCATPSLATGGLAELMREAEALHTTLGQAKGQVARLLAGLRSHRKKSRLVHETLRSLRAIGLAEAVE